MNKKLFTVEIFPNRILSCVFSLSQKEQAGPIKALISNLEGFLEEGRGRLAIVQFYWLVEAASSCCFTV